MSVNDSIKLYSLTNATLWQTAEVKLGYDPIEKIMTIIDSPEFKSDLYAGLDDEKRDALGQIYTPGKICIKMIDKFGWTDLSDKTILDPTVGSGNLLIACLIAGANPEKLFGNEYDLTAVKLCRERLNRACDILGKPHIKDWQIHQGNALHKFALTEFGDEYYKLYFNDDAEENVKSLSPQKKGARTKKLNNPHYDVYVSNHYAQYNKEAAELARAKKTTVTASKAELDSLNADAKSANQEAMLNNATKIEAANTSTEQVALF